MVLDVVRVVLPVDDAADALHVFQVVGELDEDLATHENTLVIRQNHSLELIVTVK